MPRRCFEYGARASIVHGLPVLSVVLWLQRRGTPPASPYEMRVGEWVQASWQFIGVEVYELAAAHVVDEGPVGLLPLTPFMRGADIPTLERAATWSRCWRCSWLASTETSPRASSSGGFS